MSLSGQNKRKTARCQLIKKRCEKCILFYNGDFRKDDRESTKPTATIKESEADIQRKSLNCTVLASSMSIKYHIEKSNKGQIISTNMLTT